jgi:hypothetical protein
VIQLAAVFFSQEDFTRQITDTEFELKLLDSTPEGAGRRRSKISSLRTRLPEPLLVQYSNR